MPVIKDRPPDREQVLNVFASLEEREDMSADGSVACCQTCGHDEMENARGARHYVFWHDQCEDAFDDSGYLVRTLYLYHSGIPAAARVKRVLEKKGYRVGWDGDPRRALEVSATSSLG